MQLLQIAITTGLILGCALATWLAAALIGEVVRDGRRDRWAELDECDCAACDTARARELAASMRRHPSNRGRA